MVLLVARSLPTLPRHVGPTAKRALHGVTAATSRRCGVTSRPALAQLASSRQPRCLGPAVTNQMGQVRLLTGEREKVKVLAVLYDGGKHADEVRSNPVPHLCFIRSKFPSSKMPHANSRTPLGECSPRFKLSHLGPRNAG
jgi:hypothetical protein